MEDFERHGKHVFVSKDSAEEVIQTSIEYIKQKASDDARSKAWDDCSEYWRKVVAEIVNDNCPSGAKVSRIRTRFRVPYDGEE